MIRFSIPGRVLSRNQLDKMHWAQRSRLAKTWHTYVLMACRQNVKPDAKRYVSLVAHLNRTLDSDNLVGGCKAIRDALVKVGMLRDDTPRWCEVRCDQVHCLVGDEHVDILVTAEPIQFPDVPAECR